MSVEQVKGGKGASLSSNEVSSSECLQLTREAGADPVLRVLRLAIAGHNVALLGPDHELGWPGLQGMDTSQQVT